MPNMATVHAAGNSFLGEAPFFGENKSGLKISPRLRDINVARNRLTGSISAELVTATMSTGDLRSLDMSYNRIGGNLSIFSGAAETYVNSTSPLHLALQVNHLCASDTAQTEDATQLTKTSKPPI
jgi:Ran GTPase-activating protein (RanGAP) involved in mRNA processing and transport